MPTTYTIELRPDGTGYGVTPPAATAGGAAPPPLPPKAPPMPAPQSPPPPPPKPTAPPQPQQQTAADVATAFAGMGAGFKAAGEQRNRELVAKQGYVGFQNPKAIEAFARDYPSWLREDVNGEARFRPPAGSRTPAASAPSPTPAQQTPPAPPPLPAPAMPPPLPPPPVTTTSFMDDAPLPSDAPLTPQEQAAFDAKQRAARTPPKPPPVPPPPLPTPAGGSPPRRPSVPPAPPTTGGAYDWEDLHTRGRTPQTPATPPTASNPFGPTLPPPPLTGVKAVQDQQRREHQRRKDEAEGAKSRAEESRVGLQDMMGPLTNRMPAGLKPLLGALGGKGGALGGLADAAAGGAGMGGVGGMAGMAKLAGGPVGLALMAKDMIHAAGGKVRETLESLGNVAGKLAKNDMTVLGDAMTGAGDAIGKVSPVAGEVVKTLGTLVNVQQRAAQAFIDRGKELQGFSGGLSAANAQADSRRMMADIREAQVMGKSLARLTEQQNRAELAFRDATMPVKEILAKHLTSLAERVGTMLENWGPKIEIAAWALEATVNLIAQLVPNINLVRAIMNTLIDIKSNTAKPIEIEPPIDEWLRGLSGLQSNAASRPSDPSEAAMKGRLNAPILNLSGN